MKDPGDIFHFWSYANFIWQLFGIMKKEISFLTDILKWNVRGCSHNIWCKISKKKRLIHLMTFPYKLSSLNYDTDVCKINFLFKNSLWLDLSNRLENAKHVLLDIDNKKPIFLIEILNQESI